MPRPAGPTILALAALVLALCAAAPAATAAPITYRTLFQDPGSPPGQDLSLEQHAIALIHATPAGERIGFAFRDFNRQPVADALIAAHLRGVTVDGVIDGGERQRPVVQRLRAALGPDRMVICGEPLFDFESCIADDVLFALQHNKFLVFSGLSDGRRDVVLQTSKNFFGPSQLSYYNDMVEIAGDTALHRAYEEYLSAMKAQIRSDDHYLVRSGDGGLNTMFPSPRRQPDPDTDDIIVDRMNEIDCSEGGSPSGRGLIRVANMAFRSERAVIMGKLVELHRAGCDIEVILTNADGDILAGLASAGIPVHPFFLRAASPRPQVIVHSKFWLVDARSTLTGERARITYAGSSNWRADQQKSDDLLLRIADDGVHAAYSAYWERIRGRAASDQTRFAADAKAPATAIAVDPGRWHSSAVPVRVAASDGHNVQNVGLLRTHVALTGAQTGSWELLGEERASRVLELDVTAEGETTVTVVAEDANGNVSAPRSQVVRIDRTPPVIAGLPGACRLWPPNHRMVSAADVTAADALSGVVSLDISASGGDEDDVSIEGGAVRVRAEKDPRGRARTYVLRATATDAAGNIVSETGGCVVTQPSREG